MISRFCSHCGLNTDYDTNKESNSHWYPLVSRYNKRSLYFLCSNCYAKQTDENSDYTTIDAEWQNRKELQHKTNEVSVVVLP
jgi:hypothetical protein